MNVSRQLYSTSDSQTSLSLKIWHDMARKAKKQKLEPGQKTMQSFFSAAASAPAALGSPESPTTHAGSTLLSAASTGHAAAGPCSTPQSKRQPARGPRCAPASRTSQQRLDRLLGANPLGAKGEGTPTACLGGRADRQGTAHPSDEQLLQSLTQRVEPGSSRRQQTPVRLGCEVLEALGQATATAALPPQPSGNHLQECWPEQSQLSSGMPEGEQRGSKPASTAFACLELHALPSNAQPGHSDSSRPSLPLHQTASTPGRPPGGGSLRTAGGFKSSWPESEPDSPSPVRAFASQGHAARPAQLFGHLPRAALESVQNGLRSAGPSVSLPAAPALPMTQSRPSIARGFLGQSSQGPGHFGSVPGFSRRSFGGGGATQQQRAVQARAYGGAGPAAVEPDANRRQPGPESDPRAEMGKGVRRPWQGSHMPEEALQPAWQRPDLERLMAMLRDMKLNPEQIAAATSDPEHPKMIRAGAGTGKTTTIIARILYYTHAKGIPPGQILAMTFTKKAATELKERLAARGAEGVNAMTNHSFCMNVLRRYYPEAGFKQMPLIWSSDAELRAVFSEAMRWASVAMAKKHMIPWLELTNENASWSEIMEATQKLFPAQYQEVAGEVEQVMEKSKAQLKKEEAARKAEAEEETTPVKGSKPNSGMSPNRRNWREEKVERVTTLEMIQRVYEFLLKTKHPRLWEGLYSPAAIEQRKREEKQTDGDKKPEYRYGHLVGQVPKKAEVTTPYKWMRRRKSLGEAPGQYAQNGDALAWSEYQRILRTANAVDFDDILLCTKDLVQQNAGIRSRLQQEFKYMLVDEYQDSNPIQIDFLNLLQLDMRKVTVVGDDFQAIYGFRGALPNVFNRFLEDFDHPNLQQPLQLNYRSRPAILGAGVAAVEDDHNLLRKQLLPTKPEDGHKVEVLEAGYLEEEAMAMARQMKELHAGGMPYESMACLFRNFKTRSGNAHKRLETAMMQLGIPYHLVRGTALLQMAVAMDAIAYMRLMVNTRDDPAFERVINKPKRGLGKKFMENLRAFQDNKRVNLRMDDSPEGVDDPAMDCSLNQCCRDMLAQGKLKNQAKKRAKEFLDFLNEVRKEFMTWTPSQTLVYLLEKSGYLEEYKAEMAKAIEKELEDRDARKNLVMDMPVPGEYNEGAPLEKWIDDTQTNPEEEWEPDSSRKLAGVLEEIRLIALQFEAESAKERELKQKQELGVDTLQNMAARMVVNHLEPEEAVAGLHDGLLQDTYATAGQGPIPLMEFMEHLHLSSAENEDEGSREGVTICTIHAAKGLEWDAVFVPRCNNEFLPNSWYPDPRDGIVLPEYFNSRRAFQVLEDFGGPLHTQRTNPPMAAWEKKCMEHFNEERRLMHVAITRGRERVFLSYVRHSENKMCWKPGQRSYFLKKLEPLVKFRALPIGMAERTAPKMPAFGNRSFMSDGDSDG